MQIKITDITPFMRKGFVYMEADGEWEFNETEPKIITNPRTNHKCWDRGFRITDYFDIAPAEDWTKSLIKVGGE